MEAWMWFAVAFLVYWSVFMLSLRAALAGRVVL